MKAMVDPVAHGNKRRKLAAKKVCKVRVEKVSTSRYIVS